ncbi:hypothetical protein M3G91_10165 [Micromonospora chalcea]|uniref:hypothetical protein n=1 Tax=Micromonospora chalcea TaxID=1874 RepID=UPI0021A79F46|nr:hypothetical protein [Micromonospora chalcea]MCT2277989.1 hypothetical protein [Micromonospora chalcea]
MPAITATVQTTWPPRVLVSVTGLTVGDGIELYRESSGRRTLVRAGASDAVADPSFLRTDAELPFGVPVSYVATVNGDTEYVTAPTVYALPGGKVAVTDAITGDSAETVIMAWPERARTRQASRFDVGGRTVVVSGPMGQPSGDVELFTASTAALEDLVGVLSTATEGVVQVRQPGGYDGVDSYLAVLGVVDRRFSQDGSDPRRIVVVQAAEVEGWAPQLEARGSTLQDIANSYDVAGPAMNANPFFETNVAGWSASGGSFARSTAQFHEGAASGLLTPSGAASIAEVGTDLAAAAAGVTYQMSAWVRCAVARSVVIGANWWTAGPTFGSDTVTSVAVPANTWTLLTFSATAPAGTVFAQMKVQMTGTPLASHLLYVDEAVQRRAFVSLSGLSGDYPSLLALAQAEFA